MLDPSIKVIPTGYDCHEYWVKTKENWIQGGGNRVSVHFAVTFLDCRRTSFFRNNNNKGSRSNVNKHELVYGETSSNTKDSPNVCLSFVLLFTIFTETLLPPPCIQFSLVKMIFCKPAVRYTLLTIYFCQLLRRIRYSFKLRFKWIRRIISLNHMIYI